MSETDRRWQDELARLAAMRAVNARIAREIAELRQEVTTLRVWWLAESRFNEACRNRD